jgi:hypothetical protein
MKLAFEKLLENNNLEVSELPKITQVEIREANSLKGLIQSKKNIGQKVTSETLQKLEDKDNAICDDILDYIDADEDEDFVDPENDSQDDDDDDDDTDGVTIDQELHNLYKSGMTTLDFNAIRNNAPAVYDCLFDTYGQDEENGINTSNYSIIETSPNSETFNITKR